MRNKARVIDKTHLSINNAETRGFLHRDYIAHCLRWTHVAKFLAQGARYKSSRILDIGCGKEVPLAKLLHSSRMRPTEYYGVDVNKLEQPEQFKNAGWKPLLCGKTDICDLTKDDFSAPPNIVVCFEVLEHVAPEHCRRMLKKIIELMEPSAYVFISTPVWDPGVGAAENHINEMTYQAMGAILEDSGFRILGHWGTFASIKDYKEELQEHEATFEALRKYYDTNYLATIFAPLFPHRSRNVIWSLFYDPLGDRKFPALGDVNERWSSSDNWEELKP